MVSNEENRAGRFQQGLKMDIQILLIPQQLKIYSQVLSIARDVERGLEKNRDQETGQVKEADILADEQRIPGVDRGVPV